MADTLESLEIEVQHSASGAADEINKVTSAVRSLGRALEKALPNLKVFKDTMSGSNSPLTFNDNRTTQIADSITNVRQAAQGAQRATNNASRGIRGMREEAAKSKGPLENIVGSLKRIAFYRIIRGAIKAITQGFQEGLKNAYAFSKGINGTLAKALDSLSTKSLTMKNQLGAALGNLLTAITPILLQIIRLVTLAAQALSALFSALGGGQYLVAKDTAKAWDTATGAAKEYKKTILGFDEINRLNDEDKGGGGGVDASDMFEVRELPGWAQAISDKLTELRGKLDFTNLLASWERLKESLQGLADTIGKGLGWAWDNILVPLAQWTINDLAPTLIELLAAAFDFLRAVLEALAPIFEPFWEDFLKPFFEFLGDLTITVLEDLIGLLEDLTALINGDISFMEFIDGLNGIQLAILALCGAEVLAGLTRLGKRLVATCSAGVKSMGALATAALGAFDAIMLMYDAQKLSEAADAYNQAQQAHNHETEVALSSYAKLYDDKGKEAADSWAWMVYQIDTTNMSFDEAQAALAEKVDSYWDGVPQNMWEGFKEGWDYYFGEDGAGLWQLLKDAFQNVLDWLRDFLGIHSPSTVFYDIGDSLVQGLWNGWKEKWDSFFQQVQTWWNGLKTWWDGLSLKTIVGQVTTGTTVNTNGFSNYSGKFANGGFPDTGELFVAREAGPELVGTIGERTAVANNDDIVAAVSSGVANAVSAVMGSGNNGNVDVHVYLDSREIRNGQTRYARAMGV